MISANNLETPDNPETDNKQNNSNNKNSNKNKNRGESSNISSFETRDRRSRVSARDEVARYYFAPSTARGHVFLRGELAS
jgi:hypothetical protein